ncbi:hypothetical protein BD309DRAFT_1076080 [Dichomitus squalens]|nr:hypothetical protein BD309DRAFT_1076080 [Dichomitus squalens]
MYHPSSTLLSLLSRLRMSSLQDELLLIEDAFIAALSEGNKSLSAFESRWQELTLRLDHAHDTLDAETSKLAYTTSLRLAALAEASVDIIDIQDNISSELVKELDALLSELTLDDDWSLMRSHCLVATSPSSVGGSSQSRKRRREGDDTPQRSTPSHKRRRSTSHEVHAPVLLESANDAASIKAPSLPDALSQPNHQYFGQNTRGVRPPTRKRRLSSTDMGPAPASTKRLYIGPRLHAVSDSYISLRRETASERSFSPPPSPAPKATHASEPAVSSSEHIQQAKPMGSQDPSDCLTDLTISTPWDDASQVVPLPELQELDDFIKSLLHPIHPAVAIPINPFISDRCPEEQSLSAVCPITLMSEPLSYLSDDCRSEDSGSSAASSPKLPLTPSTFSYLSPAVSDLSTPTFDIPLSDAPVSSTCYFDPLLNAPLPLDGGVDICQLQETVAFDCDDASFHLPFDKIIPFAGDQSVDPCSWLSLPVVPWLNS